LYNEDLTDLLNPGAKRKGDGWGGLTIREDGRGGVYWSGVKEEEVHTVEELMG